MEKKFSLLFAVSVNIILGIVYFFIGSLVGLLIEVFIYPDVKPNNASDLKILITSLFKIIILIIAFMIIIFGMTQLITYYESKGHTHLKYVPLFFTVYGSMIMIQSLSINIKYLLDKYISHQKSQLKIDYKMAKVSIPNEENVHYLLLPKKKKKKKKNLIYS